MKYFENVIYPENCKAILDVTKAPYFVDNTGQEDCTEKLICILNDILSVHAKDMEEVYETLCASEEGTNIYLSNRVSKGRVLAIHPYINQTPIIYFPNGTYLISDTITYTIQNLHNMMYHYESGGLELARCIRIMGQNRDKTIIKLKDNCKGFEYGQERPVVSFFNGTRSNVAMSNYLENITIDTGVGNAGAVGVVYFANNSGAIRNVTIKSSDTEYRGAIGISIKNDMHSACNVYDTCIEGFNFGIKITTYRTVAHFERIELKNQRRYGIEVLNNAAQFIGVKSEGNVPVLNVSGPMAHVVLTDGEFISQGTDYTAIKLELGCVYLKNIYTKGFAVAFERNWYDFTIADGYIKEYCNKPTFTLFDDEAAGVDITVPDMPEVAYEQDLSQWCCVNDFGAVGDGVHDDTDAIIKAFSSGKRTFWFQPGNYLITRPIEITENVEHINFMYCDIIAGEELRMANDDAVFRICGDSQKMLLLEKLFSWDECIGHLRMFRQDNIRTIFFRDMHTQACAFYYNTVPGSELFFENCACTLGKKKEFGHIPAFSFEGQTVWCHSINPERSMVETLNNGGTLWWSGFKVEQEGAINVTINGGKSAILGGVATAGTGSNHPLIFNQDSDVSAIFATTGYHEYSTHPVAVREIRGGVVKEIRDKELPTRCEPWYFMPLYSGKKEGR